MDNRIYIQWWLRLKPYTKQVLTDTYYLGLSNKIKQALEEGGGGYVLGSYLHNDDMNLLCCFFGFLHGRYSFRNQHMAALSVNQHQAHYGKKTSIFNDQMNHFDDEINQQDVTFLIWYFLNTVQEEKFISPYNDFLLDAAHDVMPILDEEYEYAPENEHIKQYYALNENETDYYKARKFIDTVLFSSYLLFTDTGLKIA
ncbi:MAG: DUF3843 family protein, partial [Bacteroidales bacterium]|nr:DUF3843 family protein [Bacteroidales bacterium]